MTCRRRPGPGAEPGGFGSPGGSVGGSYGWLLAMSASGSRADTITKVSWKFRMKSFADIRIGYRYEFFRYHCIAICWVFSTQSSSGLFFKQIIMFLWYIIFVTVMNFDETSWSVLMVI